MPGSGDSGDGGASSGRIPRAGSGWQGRRRRTDGGRRGVSIGVIAALVAVVVLVGGVILWRFFGDALSRRSSEAAQQCLAGTAAVAVVADPSIAEAVTALAETYNDTATPVGDTCVRMVVTSGASEAVVTGLSGSWPAELGERPALWIPASSIHSARLQASAGAEIVSDARSLVTSPVVLAVRPQLKDALADTGWAGLPGLQTDPAALDGRNLPGWGSLRLALPAEGSADADYLTAEAVAASSAPPGTPATAGLPAATALLGGAPRLPNDSADEAWSALVSAADPAAAPVHAVALTEQQLYRRAGELADAAKTVAEWIPAGPGAVADYPTVLLSGPWLTPEALSAASEFARFMRREDQLAALADAGFRTPDATAKGNDVVTFAPLPAPLPVGDDPTRAALAAAVTPGAVATTTVMLQQNLTNAATAVRNRAAALPPTAAVGLWIFDGTDSSTPIPTGPLSDPLGGQPRSAALAAALGGLPPGAGGAVSFTTMRLAFADAVARYVPGQPNSVLVITTGPHTDRTLDGPGLQDFVTSAVDPNRPVAINVIDIGGDPDRPVWEAVAKLTGGSYTGVPSADSPELTAAISRLLG